MILFVWFHRGPASHSIGHIEKCRDVYDVPYVSITKPDLPKLLSMFFFDQVACLGKEQRISTYDALLAVTRHAAYQHYEENQKGSIEVGKNADFVVLDRDPLSVAPENLDAIKVDMTISRGSVVFDRQGR